MVQPKVTQTKIWKSQLSWKTEKRQVLHMCLMTVINV